MSHLQYFNYKGFGERVRNEVHYSQAVVIGNNIEISGQGGWNRETEEISKDWQTEVDQAFENVNHALQTAGGKGWEQVYKVRAYIVNYNPPAQHDAFIANLKKWAPRHAPLFTVVGVTRLGLDGMNIEIEVEANVPK